MSEPDPVSALPPAAFRLRPFRPAWWLPGPHGQTLAARAMRSRLRVPFHRERLELPDGDFVDLDHPHAPPVEDDDRPLVLVLHGLEGSARSGYAQQLYLCLKELGIDSLGLNFRGCSGEMNRLPRFYHSGDTGDVRYVVETLRRRHPARRLGAIGVSIGANVLTKYLGESGEGTPLQAAAAISVPFDLAAGAAYLRRAAGRIYSSNLLRSLKEKLRAKNGRLPPGVDVPAALAARHFLEFDEAATAPLHGFDSAAQYHQDSSSGRFVDRVRVPMLVLHSTDDPFLPAERVPRASVEANPYLANGITDVGGHVGFVAGSTPGRPTFWAEAEASRFVALQLTP